MNAYAALYPDFKTLALSIGGASNLVLAELKQKHLATLGRAYGLDDKVLLTCFAELDGRRKAAEKAVSEAARKVDANHIGKDLLDLMERRWNGGYASIGPFLSKKQSAAGEA